MVAMSLVVLIFALVPVVSPVSQHNQLKSTIEDLDRAVRFASNESILKNKIVRIKFDLSAEPQEYTIEFGKKATLVLPEAKDTEKLSIKEREQEEKAQSTFDSQFSTVDELYDKPKQVPDFVRIFGVASDYSVDNKMIEDGSVSIYFYPTGEKDNAIVILTTEEQVASISIPPFQEFTDKEYYNLEESELENLDDSLDNRAREMVSEWYRN